MAAVDGEELWWAPETGGGARVAGVKWWFHVACTALLTFLGVHRRRGLEATDHFAVLPRVRGTLVHDRWAPYWRYTAPQPHSRSFEVDDLAPSPERAASAC